MTNQEGKLTYREALRRNRRAWCIWWKKRPAVLLSRVLYALAAALSPYVTIWLSAQIVNELAWARRIDVLLRLVVIQLAMQPPWPLWWAN
ncbi:MAG: hypothetical protein LUD82_07000 [Clostridiales bacterium]|nr:hypothetical protein [Clostridiales bacterium]